LRRCIASRIRHALDELPETLDGTYERTLLDIDKENWAYAHRLFQCLVAALRPLRVEELADFLAFKFEEGGTPVFQADCRPEDPRDAVLSTCSSLIAVVDDRGSTIVQFSHFSVKEYLTSTRITEGHVPRYHTPLEPAHFLVTRACLSILLQQDDQITEKRMKDLPLLHYAADYWVEHAKLGNALSETEDVVKRLFDPRNPHFKAWISIYTMDYMDPTDYSESEYSRATPLYYAALFNLCNVAEWLVNKRSQNINALGGEHGTPLHAASATGSLEVAQFLLMYCVDGNRVSDDHTLFYVTSEGGQVSVPQVLFDQRADINATNDDGETPLTVALRHGPMESLMEATNILLSHGANPNSTGKGWSPIHAAVSRGHRDVVDLLQTHGADPNSRVDDGRTLLHVASKRGNLKVAQRLLELGAGADINSRDNEGRTPLHVIMDSGSDDIALLLLEHGADPCIRDDAGRTSLHAASRSRCLKFARRLLELGIDVNTRDDQGRTPLHVIWTEDVGLLLLEHGADPGIRDNDGQTPLHAASHGGNLKFARRLVELGVGVDLRDNQGRTPLHVVHPGDDEVALLLLERGAAPGIRDDGGQTPLHVASQRVHLKSARRLLDLSFDVNTRDNQGRTPLHVVPPGGDEVALLLLERGSDPNVWDDNSQTPLHAASRSRCLKFARRLLELGIDVNTRDNQGRTPLHVLGWSADDVALLLLEHGADPGVRDDNGKTLLHAASRSESLKFARWLLDHGFDLNSRDNQGGTPLHVVPPGGDKVALLLLDRGADPGVRDNAGKTLLHAASQSGTLKFVLWLLDHGFDVNSRDNQGRTPLHVVYPEDDEVALLLLERGADPGVRDNAGKSLLHAASQWNCLKFARWLLDHGFDVNSRDNQGRTPLHVVLPGSDEVALLFLERGADPGVRDDTGQTLLHAASRGGCLKFARSLLELGFDANSRDNQGRTPLHVIEWETDDVALLLLKHGADPGIRDDAGQTPLHAASRWGSLRFARHLLGHGFDVNSRDNQGRTPLHVIEWWSNDFQLPLVLLEGGADQGARDNDGHTPLHAVARWGKLKVAQRLLEFDDDLNVNEEYLPGRTFIDDAEQWCNDFSLLLLERGADPGIRNNDGQSALHVASREGNLSVVRQLLKFDVDINSYDSEGRTPLQLAVEGGHEMVEKLLLEHGAERS